MFYVRDLVFRGLCVLLFMTTQHCCWECVGKVEFSWPQSWTELDRAELDRAEPGGGQASGLPGLVGLTSSMGTFFVGQDFRRHSSKNVELQPIGPLPTPAPVAQRAGDVEVGGVHLLEFHWNTVVGGGGLVLLIVGVIALTYCCV